MPNEFEQIRDDYYHAWFRFHPEIALDVGVQGYAHLLRPYTDEDQGALLTLNEKLLAALEEFDESSLTPNEQIDFELMRGAAFLEMEEILNFDWRKRDPEMYIPMHAVYQLTIKETEDFAQALRQRLSLIPVYLRNARQYLSQEPERIPQRWLESTLIAIESGISFIRDLPKDKKVQAHLKVLKDLNTLIADAVDGLRQYGQFLEQDIGAKADGEFAVGTQRFTHLLRYRHFLELESSELYDFGVGLFDRTEQQVKKVCRRLTGSEDIAALDERIQSDHATDGSLLAVYKEQMNAAREFAISSDLVQFPKVEQLSVIETPIFLRHKIPFAAYDPPSRGDAEQHGYYFVTAPRDGETVANHNSLALMHTCVHEAYPGHHLQFVTANQNSNTCTLPRVLNKSASLYEGWALYCEQLMFEKGFLNQPENEFILLKDRLWRALRVMLDVGIHTRGQSLKNGTEMMVDRLGFPYPKALSELTWYSRAPTTPLGYATGWAMINAARDLTDSGRTNKSLKSFHNKLLANGSIALALGINRSFGDEVAKQVQAGLHQVYKESSPS